MNKDEFDGLYVRGAILAKQILQEIDSISREHIRMRPEQRRRPEDWGEIFIALALLERLVISPKRDELAVEQWTVDGEKVQFVFRQED